VVPRFRRGWPVTNTVLILSIGPRNRKLRVHRRDIRTYTRARFNRRVYHVI